MSKAAVIETNEQGTGVQQALSGPQRLIQFFHDTREEMRKVSTPSREQVQSTTIVVVVTVFLFAAYFFLVDAVIGKGIDQMFQKMTK
jgi:preprotein translocase subunit SecE